MTEEIENYYDELTSLINSLDLQQISTAAKEISSSIKNGNNVFIAGNGGSATTATHFSNDLIKAISSQNFKGVVIVSLPDNSSTLTAISNDHSFDASYRKQLELMMRPNDVLIALSVSGNSKNLVSAAEFANKSSAKLISITGFNGGELRKMSDFNVHVESHAGKYEVVEDIHLSIVHLLANLISSNL